MHFNFAIIGGGLTATAMLCGFVNRVQEKAGKRQLDPARIRIQIFEKQDIFGPGFPHSGRFALPFHITNMCASDMGILDGKPLDFQDWVTNNSVNLANRFSWFRDSSSESDGARKKCNHYPRAIMGEYLKTRFQEAVQLAQNVGLAVYLYPASEVIDLKLNSGKIRLIIKDLSSENYFSSDADRVLLATGHWFEKNDQDHYFTSPWPAKKLLRNIPKGEKVAVIGTSLSAIETLLTLTSDGKFIRSRNGELAYAPPEDSRRFFLYSRRGLLPKVRGQMGNYKNKFLNRENLDRLLSNNRSNLTLDAIFKLLDSELEDAYGQTIDWKEIVNPTGNPAELLQRYLDDAINGDGPHGELIWQTILHQSFDMLREVYLNLTIEDRRRFDKTYTSVFFTHAASQPSINAAKLLALMKAGIVEVIKLGDDYRLVKNEVKDCYEFIYRDIRGNLKKDAFRYVVNARGQEKSLKTNPSALARNLLRSGTVQIEEIRPVGQPASSGCDAAYAMETAGDAHKTGSIWIDPETFHVMQMGPEKKVTRTEAIYAVGAMTRGQIIDASMAHGIVQAISRIADDLVNCLIRII
ncbi:MAG: FAD/NAD(P)-binding protein [Deltaproteobacteria bacterium]|nr:FAD/NAD(P)-binding protein [Deltaproteobacteria bacterium]